jgi:DNA-binding transcriptional MerR regulator
MIEMNQHPEASSSNGRPPESSAAQPEEGAARAAPASPAAAPRADDPMGRDVVPELGWPVGAVADRLGIAAPTLRSWDRRHGVGPSLRTTGNHRRYTELDIHRVLLMSRLTAQGLPAQSAADSVLTTDARSIAERLADAGGGRPAAGAESDRRQGHEPGDRHGLPNGDDGPDEPEIDDEVEPRDLVEAVVAAARVLDARTMAQLYRQVMRRRDVGRGWVEVFAPALRRVGDLWEEGRVGVQAEHLTSELLQTELRAVIRANRLRVAGSPVILASADDEQHHLPLLALEAELARNGVAALFLGPRVPSDALLSTLRETRSRAVFLWASLPRQQDEPFWRALGVVDWPLEVVLGGPGWPDGVTAPEGPVAVTRITDFSSAVRVLLTSPGGLLR